MELHRNGLLQGIIKSSLDEDLLSFTYENRVFKGIGEKSYLHLLRVRKFDLITHPHTQPCKTFSSKNFTIVSLLMPKVSVIRIVYMASKLYNEC